MEQASENAETELNHDWYRHTEALTGIHTETILGTRPSDGWISNGEQCFLSAEDTELPCLCGAVSWKKTFLSEKWAQVFLPVSGDELANVINSYRIHKQD